MEKQTQILMLPGDEADFSKKLLQLRPGIRFIDDNVWDGPTPRLVESIDRCQTNFCFLWDPVTGKLPVAQREDGRFEGPGAGMVVQCVRCRLVGNMLLSGRLAAGFSDTTGEMAKFVRDVWKALRSVVGARPSVINIQTGEIIRSGVTEYQLGLHAEKWASDPQNKLRDRSSLNLFFAPSASRTP